MHHHFTIISSSFLRPKGGKKHTVSFTTQLHCRPKALRGINLGLLSSVDGGDPELSGYFIDAKITYLASENGHRNS
jgi:hypothetical protein